jgi:4-carboxymuconolactone decarboxylase
LTVMHVGQRDGARGALDLSQSSGLNGPMEQYLPKIYVAFREAHPDVAQALDDLGRAAERSGPLDERTQRLVKIALAIGSLAEGAVRSNARKAVGAGDTPEEIRHVALLAITTCGFPTAIAGLGWVNEVLGAEMD